MGKKLLKKTSLLPILILGILLVGLSGLIILAQNNADLRSKAYSSLPSPNIVLEPAPVTCSQLGSKRCAGTGVVEECQSIYGHASYEWRELIGVTINHAYVTASCGQKCIPECIGINTIPGVFACYCPPDSVQSFEHECTKGTRRCEEHRFQQCDIFPDPRLFGESRYQWRANGWLCDPPNPNCGPFGTNCACPQGTDASLYGFPICQGAYAPAVITPYTLKLSGTSRNYSTSMDGTKALDENLTTAWNAGSAAPQWIRVDLGKVGTVSQISLIPNQSPATATTTQKIYTSSSVSSNSLGTLVATLTQSTTSGKTLEKTFSPPLTNVRYLTIQTTSSPSWVSWFEIQVLP